MPETSVVTDSVACLPQKFVDQYGLDIIPLTFIVGGKTYRDGIDINSKKAYELFLQDPEIFKAAPSTPEDCLSILRQASQKAKNVLCITLSQKVSTEYNIIRLAMERAKNEIPETRIEVIDSETATAAQGLIVLAAARAANSGKSFREVIDIARNIKKKVHALVLLDTVRYVYRSGRVPKIAAQAASVLNIKPIFNINGSVHFVTAARSKKNGIERLLILMRDKVGTQPIRAAVMHAYDPEEALKIKQQIVLEFNCIEIWISEFSPVMGYATGTGTLGIAFYSEA